VAALRVLFVNEGAPGGQTVGHAALAATLRSAVDADIDARFETLPPLGPVTDQLASRALGPLARADIDLQPQRWHAVQAARARRFVRAALERHRPDVLHLDSHVIGFGLLDAMRRIPTFLSVDATVWQWRALAQGRPVRGHSRAVLALSLQAERRAFQRAAGVFAWTAWSAAGVRAASPGALITEVFPGVDTEMFRPGTRGERARPRVLFVGGSWDRKGGADLVAALGPMVGHDFDLDVVTNASTVDAPGATVHRRAPGAPELVALHQQADIFCLPSHADAAPFAVVEAMACATPVVASSVGAIGELLDGGRAGLLIAPGDVEALREAVTGLLADPTTRSRLGGAGRERAVHAYDAAAAVRRMVDEMRQATALP
jgi:glycosyltransferase involved in cell wall biosynthesis